MTKNQKDWLQHGSACFMLVSGVFMAFLCFFLNGYEITNSVLWYVAQCLMFAGAVFGLKIYIDDEITSRLQKQ